MWGKPKKFDPNQIITNTRVMDAEFKIIYKKEEQVFDNWERKVAAFIKAGKATEVYEYTHKAVMSQRKIFAMQKVTEALKMVRADAAQICDRKFDPNNPEIEQFRIICTSYDAFKVESFGKFRTSVIKELYGAGAVKELSDVSKLDPAVRSLMFGDSIDNESEISDMLIRIGNQRIGDVSVIEELLGITLIPKDPEPEIPDTPPPANGNSPTLLYPNEFEEHVNLFTPMGISYFDRNDWPRILAQIRA